jgi:primosomal protein N' (replication factor Y)
MHSPIIMTATSRTELFDSTDEAVPAQPGLFAEVVFDRPLDHGYSYAVPEQLRDAAAIGKRLLVPFGRGDRPTVGYCVGLNDTAPARALKEVLRVLDDEALLNHDLLRLTRWMADYYLCGWGQVLHAVIPAGARHGAGTRQATFLEAVQEPGLTESAALTPKQRLALDELRSAGGPLEARQLASRAHCGPGPIEALVKKGYVRRVVRRMEQPVRTVPAAGEPEPAITMNADQLRAWQPIEQAVRAGGFRAFLLHGVTGSGKTEIYLRALDEVVQQGKQVLVLVPEISLTPQTIQRFRGRCGDVAVLHSHLSDAERGHQWRQAAAGVVQVIVGARSAVFAPAHRLGLIVVDEEHESTFKQETTPRYNARDVAVMRARLESIPIILGSATPSLESWHNAQRGQYSLVTLPNRVLDRPLPHVQLIDLRHEGFGRGRLHGLSTTLESAMREALREGGQVILLLNRRGYSTFIHCPACGTVAACKFCDLTMTYHLERDVMLCHYCGYEEQPVRRCMACGAATVRYQGLGTEKLHAEIVARFPEHVVGRMDSDSMRRPGSHARVLSEFRRGRIHILLGTQMIAKGLDFPNVTLVGVVNADIGLNVPDFRSAERTFQLLAQVAGRAGRGPRGGRVLIQTYHPEQPCIALAARHDYLGFAARELATRREHQYPPFQRLARVIVRGKDEAVARAFAERLAGAFGQALQRMVQNGQADQVRLLGPAEAPIFRLKGQHRFHFQLQAAQPGALHRLLREVLPPQRPPSGITLMVDVDPHDML